MRDHHAKTRGVHHVGLSVADLAATHSFFVDALGFSTVGGIPDYPAVFLSDGDIMITLWKADAPATPFDRRRNIGLHHLALRVDDLESISAELQTRPDVDFEFLPEPLGDTGLRHMMCSIPGNLRVEFIEA